MANQFSLAMPGGGVPRPLTMDERFLFRSRNPHTRILPIAGRDLQVAPTFTDLMAGLSWQNEQVARATRGPGGGLSIFGGPTPANLTQGSGFNPFSTLRNVKNPGIESAVDTVLGQVRNLSLDPNVNTNVVKANVKDPATASRIGGAGQRFDVDVNDTRQSFSDFAKQFMASQPQAQKFFDQESAAIGNIYDPNGLQAQLNRMSEGRQRAITTQAQRAIANAIARANAGRMGLDTYANAQMMDTVGGIGAQAARERADLDRLNLLGVTDMQTRLGGQRGNMLNQLLTRRLLPIDARQRMAGNELAQLAGLSNLTNANTFYQLDSPEALLARRLGLIGQGSQIDLANTFYGLQKPYEPNFAGYAPIGVPSYGGGFNFPMDIFGGGQSPLPINAPGSDNDTAALLALLRREPDIARTIEPGSAARMRGDRAYDDFLYEHGFI